MSDSGLSDAPSSETPPDSEIQTALRNAVTKAAKGAVEDYTVSKIRKTTEKKLGLPDGFFKADENWKVRSKSIIEQQVELENASVGAAQSPPKSKQSTQPKAKPSKPVKRASPTETKRPRKKQKLESDGETSALSTPPSESEDDFVDETPKEKKKANKQPAKPKPKAKSVSKPKVVDDGSEEEAESADKEEQQDKSDSEMSVVLDEAPTKKQRSKGKAADPSDKKSKPAKSKPKTSAETDPDQEEIKRLQGWLAKCGIRKFWAKELKPFDTTKAKIKHLKGMLDEAGMSGRYSNEKAAQIKEARELAADIEAVQEGNERWGKSDNDEDGDDDNKTRGGRRLVRGAKAYDFLSSDGEETD